MPSGLAFALLVAVTTVHPGPVPTASPVGRIRTVVRTLAGYLDIVATCRAGRIGDAASTLLVWSDTEVDQAVRGLVRLRGKFRRCTVLADEIAATDLDAAVMLHTDAAVGAYNRDDWPRFAAHLDRTRQIIESRAIERNLREELRRRVMIE